VGVVISFWLGFGAMGVSHKQRILPPLSVEQCSLGSGNFAFFPYSLDYSNYTFNYMYIAGGIGALDNSNKTIAALPGSRRLVVSTV